MDKDRSQVRRRDTVKLGELTILDEKEWMLRRHSVGVSSSFVVFRLAGDCEMDAK
jgi:hypothetical protein